jgi:hypothetical protein
LPTGDVTNAGSGSCYQENGADIIATYTAVGTEPLIFTWSNVSLVNGTWRNYEIWRNDCDPALGVEEFCDNATANGVTATIWNVSPGDVFYMKAIAESSGDDFTSATFQVDLGTPPPPGETCAPPASVSTSNHSVDGNGHDCWAWTVNSANMSNDHNFTCDSAVGGDVVIEYTTGATATTLEFDASINNWQTSGYIAIEITGGPCTTGASQYCFSALSTGTFADAGTIAVQPNTTYYIWLADGYAGNYQPDINVCLWDY